MLVDEMSGIETIERKGLIEGMRLVVGHRVGKDVAGTGRRLEPAGPPAAVEVKPLDLSLADNRAGVGRRVDDAAPLAVEPHAREHREELDDCRRRVLNHVRAASLRVTIVVIDAGGGCGGWGTNAWSGWLSIGMRMPAMRARTDEWPAATQPTRSAPM